MSTMQEFIEKCVDKRYEKLSFRELSKAPVQAISGVSDSDAADLKKAFGIDTIEELGRNKYVHVAQAITAFSKISATILDRKFESAEFEKLRKNPVGAISGVSEDDAKLLKRAFGIDTIEELAENKYVKIAQVITAIGDLERMIA